MLQRLKCNQYNSENREFNLSFIQYIFFRIFRKIIYNYIRFRTEHATYQDALNTKDRKEKIIVSMTSFPARFDNIYLCLKSIMLQTIKPDKIIVWLDEWVTRDMFTESMKRLEECGVEYRISPGNLKPHKKYIHAIKEYPNDLIITVDDDLIYAPQLIESLLKIHYKFPKAVCARRVHKMLFNENGELSHYNDWLGEYRKSKVPANNLIATGVGGVLYPPNCLDKRAFNFELIEKLCLNADDIWLKYMEAMNGVLVVWAPCLIVHPEAIEKVQRSNLRSSNVEQNQNDVYINNVSKYFDVNPNIFYES